MKKGKRLLRFSAVMLSLVMLISSVGLSAAAAGNTPEGMIEAMPSLYSVTPEEYASFLEQYGEAVGRLYNGVATLQERIDVSDLHIPREKAFILTDTMDHLFPEMFYVTFYNYSYSPNGDQPLIAFLPWYAENGKEMQQQFFENAQEKYLSLISDDMDDFTKALILHDEMMVNAYYPDSGFGSNYTYMVEDWGVCQYYSQCYAYLLAQTGIKCEVVYNKRLNHAWVKALINGEYYNIDPTLDDPDWNCWAKHEYFLYSDDAFPNHSLTTPTIHSAVSTKYDRYQNLHGLRSRLCYIDGIFYTTTADGRLVIYNPADDSFRLVKNLDFTWYSDKESNTRWWDKYAILDSYRGKLYYNSPDAIYEYDPATGAERQVFHAENDLDLYGFRIYKGQVMGYYANDPSGSKDDTLPNLTFLTDLRESYTVSVDKGITGGAVSTVGTAHEGDTVTLNITPDEGNKVSSVKVNGTPIEPAGDVYSFTMPASNVTVTATFIRDFFIGHSLSLKGDIGVNFYLDLSPEEAGNAIVDFAWDVNGVTKTATLDLSEEVPTGNGYRASCSVAPAEMTSEITATLTISGKVQEDIDFFSAVDYADVIMNDQSYGDYYAALETAKGNDGAQRLAQLRRVVACMLNFGTAAQEMFSVNLDQLANTGLDEAYAMAAVDADTIQVAASDMTANLAQYGLEYTGSSLICRSNTAIRHYYRIVNKTLFNAVKSSLTIDGEPVSYQNKNNEIYIEQQDIPASYLDAVYTLTIGTDHYDYSVLHYVKNALQPGQTDEALRTLATALYWYNDSANAFFGT